MRRRWRFSVRIHCKMAPLQPGKGHILDSGNLHLLFFSKVSMKNYSTPSATRRWKVKWQKYSYWLVVFESVFSTIHSQNVMLMIRQKNYLQKELPSKRTVRKLVAWKIRFFCMQICSFRPLWVMHCSLKRGWEADCFIAQVFAFLPRRLEEHQAAQPTN